MIQGGYIKIARSIIESDVFGKPPLYLKVWLYLLAKAYYAPNGGERNGEVCVSVDAIRQGCSHQIGYRKEVPERAQVYQILRYFKANSVSNSESDLNDDTKDPMIETAKTTHYMRIKILNFEKYQDIDAYYEDKNLGNHCFQTSECNSDGTSESPYGHGHETETATNSAPQSLQLKKRKNIYSSNFDSFWAAYPRKVGKPSAQKAFSKLQVNDVILAKMLDALHVQKQSEQWQHEKFIPHPATWLNDKRWETEEAPLQAGGLTKTRDGTLKF